MERKLAAFVVCDDVYLLQNGSIQGILRLVVTASDREVVRCVFIVRPGCLNIKCSIGKGDVDALSEIRASSQTNCNTRILLNHFCVHGVIDDV